MIYRLLIAVTCTVGVSLSLVITEEEEDGSSHTLLFKTNAAASGVSNDSKISSTSGEEWGSESSNYYWKTPPPNYNPEYYLPSNDTNVSSTLSPVPSSVYPGTLCKDILLLPSPAVESSSWGTMLINDGTCSDLAFLLDSPTIEDLDGNDVLCTYQLNPTTTLTAPLNQIEEKGENTVAMRISGGKSSLNGDVSVIVS